MSSRIAPLLIAFSTTAVSTSSAEAVTPTQVRAAAVAAGLFSLAQVPVPRPHHLGQFLKPGADARRAAIQLGKALFWDMQVGSDGQACGSCHFHAGADNRTRNQLSPGLKNVDPALQGVFDPTGSGADGGPNYRLTQADFPFHRLQDPEEENFRARVVEFDTDDVASSQGVFNANFGGIVPGQPFDIAFPFPDPVFNLAGINVRRVEPRHTPTIINAVFNFANLWDGRAHNIFNGVSNIGPLDPGAAIRVVNADGTLSQRRIRIPNSSLASQTLGPPLDDREMSFFNRPFPEIARKLLNLRPLGLQRVHPRDSVLGHLSRAKLVRGRVVGDPGLTVSYPALIKQAFLPKYWDSNRRIGGFTLMEQNFTLFFGLAIQMYESTLVSERTPFDRFMEGGNAALTEEQLQGLLVFINRGPGQSPAADFPALFAEVGQGNCVACHGGPEFTVAAFTSLTEDGELELIEVEETPRLVDGRLQVGTATTFLDNGFSNIGVRPTHEDLGRGEVENGFPLSFARQAVRGLDALLPPELPACGRPGQAACPSNHRVAVDGAFKVPSLRNVESTGPYFHNGGQATLSQVVEFYDRQGDFGDVNLQDLDRNMALIDLDDVDEEPLVRFLLALTDERVRNERAPFDHPQLFVPNGHRADPRVEGCNGRIQACDNFIEIPAVGAGGRRAAGLPPLRTFLGLDPLADLEESPELSEGR